MNLSAPEPSKTRAESAPPIAFLGLGAMGSRMAARLLAADAPLSVWTRSAETAAALAERGARQARSPREAAEGAALVVSMLRDDAASRETWLDPSRGAVAGLGSDSLAIECSTISIEHAARLRRAIESAGRRLLEAPVAGSRPQAEAGALIFLLGGDAAAVETARPALERMGQSLVHAGGPGAGAAAKLLVNAFFGVQLAAAAEILGLGERLGLSPAAAAEILAATPVAGPAAKAAMAAMAARAFAPAFPIDLVVKDFGLITDAAEKAGADAPVSAAAGAVFHAASAAGYGSDNITGVAQLYWDDR